jgi:adenylate kinase
MQGRAAYEGRTDDAPETIRHRVEVYRRQTEPLVAYYLAQGILVGIDAGGTIDEVYAEIETVLAQVEQRVT